MFCILAYAAVLHAGPLDTRIAKLQFFGPDNSIFLEIVLFYDERGNIIKSRQYDQFMRVLGVEEYFFDGKGTRFKEITYDSGRQIEKYTLIEVEAGRRIRKAYNSDDILIMITEDEYDKNGVIKKVTEYSVSNGKKGEVQSVSEYTYRGKKEIKCVRSLSGGDTYYYYIIGFNESGQIEGVTYYNIKDVRTGYVKIIHEKGVMTEQSLDLVIY